MNEKRTLDPPDSLLNDLSTETLGLIIQDIGTALLENRPGRTKKQRNADLAVIGRLHERRKAIEEGKQ